MFLNMRVFASDVKPLLDACSGQRTRTLCDRDSPSGVFPQQWFVYINNIANAEGKTGGSQQFGLTQGTQQGHFADTRERRCHLILGLWSKSRSLSPSYRCYCYTWGPRCFRDPGLGGAVDNCFWYREAVSQEASPQRTG